MNKLIENTALFFKQFTQTIPMHKEGFDFIKKHQPWKGMDKYSWTARVLLLASLILGYYFFKDTIFFIKELFINTGNAEASFGSFITDFNFKNLNWTLHGTKKYLILIVLEIFTFHFIQRTLELQMGRKPDFSFKTFIAAEKRMIKASFAAWIMEIVFMGIAKFFTGIIGLSDLLNEPVGLLIQFYFLGFIIIDNYHECFGLSLKESQKRTKQVAGVALAVGGVAYFLMFIPLIGVVAATMIGAVTSTLAMERFAPMETEEGLV